MDLMLWNSGFCEGNLFGSLGMFGNPRWGEGWLVKAGTRLKWFQAWKKKHKKAECSRWSRTRSIYIYIYLTIIYIYMYTPIHMYHYNIHLIGTVISRHPSSAKVLPSRLLPLPMTLVTWVVATSSSWSAFGWKIGRVGVAWKLLRNA